MKSLILPFLLCLFCCSITTAQNRYDQLMSEGSSALKAFEYSKAIRKFKAAKIGSDATQIKEADKQIEFANEAFIKAIQEANEETKLALEQSKLEARISEANRLAFMANQYVEKENYEEAFQIATIAMSMVEQDPTNLVEKSFGDAAYRKYLKVLKNKEAPVLDIEVAPKGGLFLVAYRDKMPVVYDENGSYINALTGLKGRVTDYGFSSDNKKIVASSDKGMIGIWNAKGEVIKIISETDPQIITDVDCSVEGVVLSVSKDNILKVWSASGEELATVKEAHRITSASFSPDGKQVLLCTAKGQVKLYETNGLQQISDFKAFENYIHQLLFTKDGSGIIVVPQNGPVSLWSNVGKLLHSFEFDGKGKPYEALISPDGQEIAIASLNGRVEVWNLKGEFLHLFSRKKDVRHRLCFSPNSKSLLSVDQEGSFVLWDLKDGSPTLFDQHKAAIQSLSFSPDGQFILSASKDHTAKLWKLNGDLVSNMDGHSQAIKSAAFLKNGDYFVTGGMDGQLILAPSFEFTKKETFNSPLAEATKEQKQKWGLKGE